MSFSSFHIAVALLSGIGMILLLTIRYRLHAFFSLLLACLLAGLCVGMPATDVLDSAKEGFGNVMKSLGLIIVLGTTLGVVLEHGGSTKRMATYIVGKTGAGRASLAMSLTGLIVGLPIFCDSAYVVLSGLVGPMAKRSGNSVTRIAISLATGLLSVHCLIPPHPGVAVAASALGVDYGRLIMFGLLIAVPAMLVGYGWARLINKQGQSAPPSAPSESGLHQGAGDALMTFLPVAVPVILIAGKSFVSVGQHHNFWTNGLLVLGDPVLALSIGVLLAFVSGRGWDKKKVNLLLAQAVEKAGSILVIIGAGGAFGAVIAAMRPGEHLSHLQFLDKAGLLFPFLCTLVLKTAQGSSTVAIITAASIVEPLLGPLGLQSESGRLLCVLSMGAGSMIISHANDAYFWVILKFSALDMKAMIRSYSLATLWMGLVSLAMVYLLSLFIQ